MPPLAIFIPGIMGSRLKQSAQAGGLDLWNEDGFGTLSQFANNPALLKWHPASRVEPDGVLEEVDVLGRHFPLCGRLRREMRSLESNRDIDYDEFAYDWRQDLFDTAKALGQWLTTQHRFTSDGPGQQVPEAEARLSIIGHSMGCLVAALAMMEGYIHPRNIHRFICIGAPFVGAPSAFRALYSLGYLPGMEWVHWWVNKRKNRVASTDALLDTLQSFPSMYQLLPPQTDRFVTLDGNGRIHPFAQSAPVPVSPQAQTAATKAHTLLTNLEQFLQSQHVSYHFIYSTASKQSWLGLPSPLQDTDDQLQASVGMRMGAVTYMKIRTLTKTEGDGTVPVDSSTLQARHGSTRYPVVGVRHAYMCDSQAVVANVRSLVL